MNRGDRAETVGRTQTLCGEETSHSLLAHQESSVLAELVLQNILREKAICSRRCPDGCWRQLAGPLLLPPQPLLIQLFFWLSPLSSPVVVCTFVVSVHLEFLLFF